MSQRSRWQENKIKLRSEKNKTNKQCKESLNKEVFFEKINKSDKTLTKLNKKEKKTQSNTITDKGKGEKWNSDNLVKIQIIISAYFRNV